MKTIFVSDMMCSHCESRIQKGLSEAGITAEVLLAEKTVKVEEKDVKKALEILDDLGFDAKEQN